MTLELAVFNKFLNEDTELISGKSSFLFAYGTWIYILLPNPMAFVQFLHPNTLFFVHIINIYFDIFVKLAL